MNTNDLINECIRAYNDKVKVCIRTWKSLPPDIVNKIESNMSACVQTLRNNISDCKYDEDYDGTKNVTFRNPRRYGHYVNLSIRKEYNKLCITCFNSTSENSGFTFSYDIDYEFEYDNTMICYTDFSNNIHYSYVDDKLFRVG